MERPVGTMKSIACMNGMEKMVCDAGFCLQNVSGGFEERVQRNV